MTDLRDDPLDDRPRGLAEHVDVWLDADVALSGPLGDPAGRGDRAIAAARRLRRRRRVVAASAAAASLALVASAAILGLTSRDRSAPPSDSTPSPSTSAIPSPGPSARAQTRMPLGPPVTYTDATGHTATITWPMPATGIRWTNPSIPLAGDRVRSAFLVSELLEAVPGSSVKPPFSGGGGPASVGGDQNSPSAVVLDGPESDIPKTAERYLQVRMTQGDGQATFVGGMDPCGTWPNAASGLGKGSIPPNERVSVEQPVNCTVVGGGSPRVHVEHLDASGDAWSRSVFLVRPDGTAVSVSTTSLVVLGGAPPTAPRPEDLPLRDWAFLDALALDLPYPAHEPVDLPVASQPGRSVTVTYSGTRVTWPAPASGQVWRLAQGNGGAIARDMPASLVAMRAAVMKTLPGVVVPGPQVPGVSSMDRGSYRLTVGGNDSVYAVALLDRAGPGTAALDILMTRGRLLADGDVLDRCGVWPEPRAGAGWQVADLPGTSTPSVSRTASCRVVRSGRQTLVRLEQTIPAGQAGAGGRERVVFTVRPDGTAVAVRDMRSVSASWLLGLQGATSGVADVLMTADVMRPGTLRSWADLERVATTVAYPQPS